MNKEEVRTFLNDSRLVTTTFSEQDGRGNLVQIRIYENSGKLYELYFCNGTVSEFFGPKGYIKGVYRPKLVTKKERVIPEHKEIYYD